MKSLLILSGNDITMKSMEPKFKTIISLFVVLLMTGCGGSDAPELGSVSGLVTLDGKPLADAQIRFQPTSGRSSEAVTDENGNYTLRYTAEENGALPGEHQVFITTATEGKAMPAEGNDEGEWVEGREELLPEKYHAKSELKETVTAGNNTINFELTSN